MYLNDIRGTHNKYSSAPRASYYNPSTGKVTIDSGCIGFGYTGNGAYYQWAKELTVVCVV